VICSHLRPLSPPNIVLAAPWLMNRPPHRKAGSSGFPFAGSTKPSTTVSAPCATALVNALFTWKTTTQTQVRMKGRGVYRGCWKAKTCPELSCCGLAFFLFLLTICLLICHSFIKNVKNRGKDKTGHNLKEIQLKYIIKKNTLYEINIILQIVYCHSSLRTTLLSLSTRSRSWIPIVLIS